MENKEMCKEVEFKKTWRDRLSSKNKGNIDGYVDLLWNINEYSDLEKTSFYILSTCNKNNMINIIDNTDDINKQRNRFSSNIVFIKTTFDAILKQGIKNKNSNKKEVYFVYMFEDLETENTWNPNYINISDDDIKEFVTNAKESNKIVVLCMYKPTIENEDALINRIKIEIGCDNIDEFNFYTFDEITKKENEIKNKQSRGNESKETNILLLAMSTLPQPNQRQVNRYSYTYKNGENKEVIEGYYLSQMEPVPKMLAEQLNNRGGNLDKIFVLNTKETIDDVAYADKFYLSEGNENNRKAFNYFKERCSFVNEVDSIRLDENNNETNLEYALSEFYSRITGKENNNEQNITAKDKDNKKINLYVDIHGGLRDSSIVIDAILMLLKDMDGIELKNIYTVEYDKGEAIIKECKDKTVNIFDFVNGMNEFLNFGRSDRLVEFVENDKKSRHKITKEIKLREELVNTINTISDGILLNRIDKFGTNLLTLGSTVNKLEKNGYFNIVKEMIKDDYKVKVDGKTYDLLDENNGAKELFAQLQWCLNKKHYQQALVLIESKTAEYLLDIKNKKTGNKINQDPQDKVTINFSNSNNNEQIDIGIYKFTFFKVQKDNKNKLKGYALNKEKTYNINYNIDTKKDLINAIKCEWDEWVNNRLCSYSGANNAKIIDNTNSNNNSNNPTDCTTKYYFNSFDSDEPFDNVKLRGSNDNPDYYSKDGKIKYDDMINNIQLRHKKKSTLDPSKFGYYNSKKKTFTIDFIPITEEIVNNTTRLKELYELLFIFMCIKKYRNKVAHADQDALGKIGTDELRIWIQLYIKKLKDFKNNVERALS